MKGKISNQFFRNYLIIFCLSILAAVLVYLLSGFTNDIISKTLVKNIYPASLLMKDDYTDIDAEPVVRNGGGIQVINDRYEVVYSKGLDTIGTERLTVSEFTQFLIRSKEKGHQYSYDILYNPQGGFWLIVTFPTSIRLDISFVYNREAVPKDVKNVSLVFAAIIVLYLLMLGLFAVVFSRISSVSITKPLKMLLTGTKRLREGDYSARVNLNLKNEFADLQDTFNDMAQKIETEISLREQAELERKRMIMDISHDLKNPLASVVGYTELCLQKTDESDKSLRDYLKIILKNSRRASDLLNDLFEFAKLESADYSIKLLKTDICEYLRQACGDLLPMLEQAGFDYNFNIPEEAVYVMLDTVQMNRVLYNLTDNLIRYNPEGTSLIVSLYEEHDNAVIIFKDNGIGIPSDIVNNIFKPFVRVDDSRNSQTGGTGLGLSIAYKIIRKHGGNIDIQTDLNQGCTFIITLPKK
ncbi:HAMP domain-containing histidine kinase [Sedimentibacter hydroxybenzoicus DSM 7310]|uniref:histidine kinase n=1 Tax=Sedimentibacter hydroxybenzoicus DSM 7310 TaxID=1123245 RepID=A0A974BN07_SEDHY|nr:HAMP domain-containing sensor histidine kinase [Sedimentibacter hydroxybenzoicus]NYB75620.1 HAMP domain-containing histidine kinase [Sedimentibacter hydroxybenzoicus DSM 7310]